MWTGENYYLQILTKHLLYAWNCHPNSQVQLQTIHLHQIVPELLQKLYCSNRIFLGEEQTLPHWPKPSHFGSAILNWVRIWNCNQHSSI